MPSVTMMRGNVRSFVTGRMKALTTPKTAATPRNGSQPPLNVTPATTRVATQSAAAFTSRRGKNPLRECYHPATVVPTPFSAQQESTHHDLLRDSRGDRPERAPVVRPPHQPGPKGTGRPGA